jgi:hypothetical protein
MRNTLIQTLCTCAVAGVLTFVTGCETGSQNSAQQQPNMEQTSAPPVTTTPEPVATASESAVPTPAVSAGGIIRIKAGSSAPFTDSSGNVWQAELGFSGGDVIDRDPNTPIANTKDPGLFLSEHYGMDSFSCKIPNGKYIAKLYFAETFDGITGPGERVFSFNVQGHEFKDFDVWVKAGGPNRAYVETVPVEVTDGTFRITFTSNVENPEINAIEIIPQT